MYGFQHLKVIDSLSKIQKSLKWFNWPKNQVYMTSQCWKSIHEHFEISIKAPLASNINFPQHMEIWAYMLDKTMRDQKMLSYFFISILKFNTLWLCFQYIKNSICLEMLKAAQNVYWKYACVISFFSKLVNSFEQKWNKWYSKIIMLVILRENATVFPFHTLLTKV